MRSRNLLCIPALAFSLLSSCRDPEPFPESMHDERLSGGSNTVFDKTSGAFSNPFPGLSAYDSRVHAFGDAQFSQTFVTAPATVNSGLGPLFNNVSCVSCHHNDGIGVPTTGEAQSSLLMRISLPGTDEHGAPRPVPGYGTQLEDKATFGKMPECRINISYTYNTFRFPDGETCELRTPVYSLTNLYIPISGYLLSPRLAPPVFGLGLLEAVTETSILALQDPADINHDGVRGKANYVWDPATQSVKLGRFGWKANTASLLTQVAAAYNQDMGITSSIFPKESSYGQQQDDKLQDDPEISATVLHSVAYYMQTLSVPARRNVTDRRVLRGKEIFKAAKCNSCHVETLTTGTNMAFSQVSNQTIHPYTDLLVHDMGKGLADDRPDFLAGPADWRTAPLWGIGLFETVNYPAFFLHDGRARNFTEAILWHGGEADYSVEYFKKLLKIDRDALITFLKSL